MSAPRRSALSLVCRLRFPLATTSSRSSANIHTDAAANASPSVQHSHLPRLPEYPCPHLFRSLHPERQCQASRMLWTSPWSLASRHSSGAGQGLGKAGSGGGLAQGDHSEPPLPDLSTSSQSAEESSSAPRSRVDSPAEAVHSPLQSLMDSAPRAEYQGGVGSAPQPRSWVWYDTVDERQEQIKERSGQILRYADAGYAKRVNADQSVKKLDRIIQMVRGLPYQEAVNQCRLHPHKAARIVVECLQKALEDAQAKGINETMLVVATIFATKGQHAKEGLIYMGKGFAARKVSRRSHITVALREAREGKRMAAAAVSAVFGPRPGSNYRGRRGPRGVDFSARVVPSMMSFIPGASTTRRPRFAYATEV